MEGNALSFHVSGMVPCDFHSGAALAEGHANMKRLVTSIVLAALSVGGLVMGDNAALTEARRAKKDEFYTQRVDIENELRHYKMILRGR